MMLSTNNVTSTLGELGNLEISVSSYPEQLGQFGNMAATGVLPFVRGIDLAHNDFSVSCLEYDATNYKKSFSITYLNC